MDEGLLKDIARGIGILLQRENGRLCPDVTTIRLVHRLQNAGEVCNGECGNCTCSESQDVQA